MNCHTHVRPESPNLRLVRESFESGLPIKWVKVHNNPDYAYFDHSAHINRGVGCVECHGRIDRMEIVYQSSSLSMGWCLECHRDPVDRLRPLDRITDMAFDQRVELSRAEREALRDMYHISPSENCSTCHR
jgi:hypothetical protein